MSGGSYSYLCFKEGSDLMAAHADIESMFSRLIELDYADDAARETLELLQIVKQYEVRIAVIKTRLEPVWKAVEWWDSADIGEDRVKEALEVYRET